MSCKKFSAENRTSVNVSKEFRDNLQKIACMYTLKYGKQISLGDLLELITYSTINNSDVSEFVSCAVASLNEEK